MHDRLANVTNIRRADRQDVLYVGRANKSWNLPASKWANPDRNARDKPVEQARAEFRAHILSKPKLIVALPELRGQILACWCCTCAGLCDGSCPCHANWLVEMLEEQTVKVNNAP